MHVLLRLRNYLKKRHLIIEIASPFDHLELESTAVIILKAQTMLLVLLGLLQTNKWMFPK